MIGFEVGLNGNTLCTAGVETGTATVIITRVANTQWQREKNLPAETSVSISGMEADSGEYVQWADRPLVPGDEIIIRVIDDAVISPIGTRQKRNPVQEREQQERYVENMATTLGWKLIKPDEL